LPLGNQDLWVWSYLERRQTPPLSCLKSSGTRIRQLKKKEMEKNNK